MRASNGWRRVESTSAAWAVAHDQYVGRNTSIEGKSSRDVLHELHAGWAQRESCINAVRRVQSAQQAGARSELLPSRLHAYVGHSRSTVTALNRLKQQARRLKEQTYALYFVARDPRTPWFAKLLAGAVVAYALSPIDLIPDFIPVLGYLDDLVLLPLGSGSR